jgi:putative ABC transport system permease protein
VLLLSLAGKSLRNRLLVSLLTLTSIALSVALLVGVENVRTGMRESFSSTIRRADLIVGARGGTLQLLLYSVFGLGSPTANVSMETYEYWRTHPAVEWTIPYSLGDNHRGFRVIGTDSSFYEHYRFRDDRRIEFVAGDRARDIFDVVVGSDVARTLGYAVGEQIELTHGLSGATGIMDHDDKPFRVVGVLARTFTPVDRALYVTLEGISAVHVGWEEGAPPMMGEEVSPEQLRAEGVHVEQITSFFVATRNRMDALRLQREINTWEDEAIMGVLPGIALAEMWRTIGYAEDGLKIVSAFVVLVGLLGMLVSLYTSLNARRREMAILRAVGAGPRRIVSLLVLESGLLSTAGALLGLLTVYALLFLAQSPVEQRFGLHIPLRPPGQVEYIYLGIVIAAGFIMGLLPAWKAYRNTLSDGLSVRL